MFCVNSLPTGKFDMLFLSSDFFFKIIYIFLNSFRNATRVSNSLDPDQVQQMLGLIWVQIDLLDLIWIQTVCKGYQQRKELI